MVEQADSRLPKSGGSLKTSEVGSSPFSEGEWARRWAAVLRVLREMSLPAVILYGNRGAPGLVPYLANFNPRWEAYLIASQEGEPVLFVQLYNHLPSARRVSRLADTRWGGPDSIEAVSGELKRRSLATGLLGIAGELPYQRMSALRKAVPEVNWVDLSRELERLRWVKSEEEISVMRRAAALTDLAMGALVEGVCPGMTDRDLPALMSAAVQPQGGQLELCYLASTPMRAPQVCVPAQNLSGRTIQKGDVIITEIGAAWKGYAGQIHRPIAIGEPPTAEYWRLYETALEVYRRISTAIRTRAAVEDVLEAADLIAERGFSIFDDLVHGFGGGYLEPILRTRQTAHGPLESFTFQKDMCIVVQPNVITPDERMGLQLGQLHRVTDDGLEALQRFPLEFVVRP